MLNSWNIVVFVIRYSLTLKKAFVIILLFEIIEIYNKNMIIHVSNMKQDVRHKVLAIAIQTVLLSESNKYGGTLH